MSEITLEDWNTIDRDGLFAEIDFDPEGVPDELLQAAERYREEHGNFPHPGFSAVSLEIAGIDPGGMKVGPIEDMPVGWFEPRISYKLVKQTVHAARTLGGVTEILSSYAGAGLHTAKKWIEVAA